MRRVIATGALAIVVTVCARAQTTADSAFDAVTARGINEVYDLQFEKASVDFQHLIAMKPHRPAGYFFSAMVTWWKILTDIDNEQHDMEFFSALDRVISMCDSILDRDPNDVDAIFFKGGAIGFRGRLKFHRNDYLAAAEAGRKALPLVEQAMALDPHNYDILLGTGIYHYYADVIPSQYPFLKPLMLFVPPGDRKKGIEELTEVSQKGKYASIESAYFLMQIYYFYEKDYPKAIAIARELHARFPDNMLFHRYLGRCQVAMFDWNGAETTFMEILDRVRKGQRGYTASAEREAEYYLGAAAMNARRYPDALQHFFRCDELSRQLDRDGPSGFMVMANLKAGNIFDATSRRDLAVEQYKKVLGMKEYNDSYALAERFLKSPYMQ